MFNVIAVQHSISVLEYQENLEQYKEYFLYQKCAKKNLKLLQRLYWNNKVLRNDIDYQNLYERVLSDYEFFKSKRAILDKRLKNNKEKIKYYQHLINDSKSRELVNGCNRK